MDKKTIIAIVICAAIFLAFILASTFLFPNKPAATPTPTPTATPTPTTQPTTNAPEKKYGIVTAVPLAKPIAEETKTFHNKVYDVTFSNKGGVITSILLNNEDKDPENKRTDDSTEMVFAYRSQQPETAKTAAEYPFSLHFGTYETPAAMDLYQMKVGDGNVVEFSRDYEVLLKEKNEKGEEKEVIKKVKVKKTFELVADKYQIKMTVALESESKSVIPFNFDGVLYTVGIGPQIGPEFPDAKPDGQSDTRQFVTYVKDGARKEFPSSKDNPKVEIIKDPFSWVAIGAKYYGIIASVEEAPVKDLILDSRTLSSSYQRSAVYIERKAQSTQALSDNYTFFIGPKKNEILNSYPEQKYAELAPITFPFGWIAEFFKYPLDFFALIGNYGVAIIILTLIIKILTYPLTRKQYDSMKKMQTLNPKLQELKARYKDDPKRLNAEMADLYKREGVSPLGGCLPLLLQFPILIGLNQLFSTHFALRHAVFIPGWITDLSVPEYIWKFPSGPVTIPLLITTFTIGGISLLPFIMLGTQLLSTFVTQGKTPSADNKMKYLPYVMMIVFFFFFYNLSSALVLYWTIQNILSVVQIIIQKLISDRKEKALAVK